MIISLREEVEARKALCAQIRGHVFARLGDDVGLVVSSDPVCQTYLSGYASMTHDVAPQYRSAVLADRAGSALVLGTADSAPALELLEDPERVYRYGAFYFEAAPGACGGAGGGADMPVSESFEDAVALALDVRAGRAGCVGVDRAGGDLMWELCRARLGEARLRDVTVALARARAEKLAGEVALIRRATRLVEEGIGRIVAEARAGLRERDLAAMMSQAMAVGGGIPRLVSVTSGPRSALADAYPSDRRIQPGETLRIDAVCTVGGYWSDMARTAVMGEPDARQLRVYAALRAGLEAELEAVRAGVPVGHLFEVAVSAVRTHGLPGYRRHHCGHGIGLRSYELPMVAKGEDVLLRAGMCLSVETPYYVLGLDGMMVEDTICVTAGGYEPITTLSRDLIVLP